MAEKLMDEKDLNDAQNALEAWFQSQDITPGNAAVIAMRVVAKQFVLKTQDPKELQISINMGGIALVSEVSYYLKQYKGAK